jgi:hypothetical protein
LETETGEGVYVTVERIEGEVLMQGQKAARTYAEENAVAHQEEHHSLAKNSNTRGKSLEM